MEVGCETGGPVCNGCAVEGVGVCVGRASPPANSWVFKISDSLLGMHASRQRGVIASVYACVLECRGASHICMGARRAWLVVVRLGRSLYWNLFCCNSSWEERGPQKATACQRLKIRMLSR